MSWLLNGRETPGGGGRPDKSGRPARLAAGFVRWLARSTLAGLLAVLAMGCIPIATLPIGWIDRFEEDWAVVVSGEEESGYFQWSLPASMLPAGVREGDWIIAGVWLPRSHEWQLVRVLQLQESFVVDRDTQEVYLRATTSMFHRRE